MEKLTKNEIQFLIDIANSKRDNSGYHSTDIHTENTRVHEVDVYFIVEKLENQLNNTK